MGSFQSEPLILKHKERNENDVYGYECLYGLYGYEQVSRCREKDDLADLLNYYQNFSTVMN